MKHLRIAAIVLALALAAGATPLVGSHPELLKGITNIANNDQASEWLTYYYKHPRPDLAESAFRFFTADSKDNQDRGGVVLAGVFAEVFRNQPKLASDLVKQIETPDQRMLLAHAIWMAKLDNSADLIDVLAKDASPEFQALAKDLEYRDPPDLLNQQVESPGSLDFLWGWYFATGDPRYIEKMASVIPWSKLQDQPERQQIGSAARWSLSSNAGQYPEVLAIIEKAAKNAAPSDKPALEDVLNRARAAK